MKTAIGTATVEVRVTCPNPNCDSTINIIEDEIFNDNDLGDFILANGALMAIPFTITCPHCLEAFTIESIDF